MGTWLFIGGLVLFIYFAIKGNSDGGDSDDEQPGRSGGRAVTHNHGSIDRFGNHDE